MRVKLVLDDWRNNKHASIYSELQGVELSTGVFHSGTTFEAEIKLDEADQAELAEAMCAGFVPVFYVVPDDGQSRGEARREC